MTNKRRHLKQRITTALESRKRIARATKRWLIFVITLLAIFIMTLWFKVGEAWWPAWLIDYRKLFLALVVFLLITVSLMSPVIIEANSNPQPFSGPGKNPYTDHWDR
jgi:hypothetical protein